MGYIVYIHKEEILETMTKTIYTKTGIKYTMTNRYYGTPGEMAILRYTSDFDDQPRITYYEDTKKFEQAVKRFLKMAVI